MMNIQNIKDRLAWCKDYRHWAEDKDICALLDEEIEVLETILYANQWDKGSVFKKEHTYEF